MLAMLVAGGSIRAGTPALWGMLLWLPPVDTAHHWRLWIEVQPRIDLEPAVFHQFIVRPGLGFQLAPPLSLWAGYAWVATSYPRSVVEHRWWQQLLWTTAVAGARVRVEEQFFPDGAQMRLRGLLRGVISTALMPIVVSNEVFVIPAVWQRPVVPGYDQNRAFLGVLVPMGRGIRAEVGYMNVHYRGDTMRHIVAISIIHQP